MNLPFQLPPLILASASPRRAELLKQLGVEFRAVTAQVPEVMTEHLSPRELCQLNAYRKARAVAKQHPDAVVVGADTLVCLAHRLFGKPSDPRDALRMLLQLEGRTHEVVTGLCLLHLRRHRQRILAAGTQVTFRPLTEAQIQEYLSRINPLDKAGAYAIQEHGHLLVERMAGSYSNVVGLPLEELALALQEFER